MSNLVDLPRASPLEQDLDPEILQALVQRLHQGRAYETWLGLLVARHGHLVLETYPPQRTWRARNDLKSATKSITGLLAGIALEQGLLDSLEQPIGDFFMEYLTGPNEPKGAIRLVDLLTMQAGLEWDEWADNYRHPASLFASRDSLAYTLGFPLAEAPGSRFRYSTGTSQLLAGLVQRACGQPLADFAQTHLFDPLGIEPLRWDTHPDGIPYGGMRLHLRPRDMLKMGLLCLDGGRWQGRRIVSARWLQQSTAVQSGADFWEGPYGYHWWVRPRGYTAYGYGGQYIYVLPRQELVVVFTARADLKRHIPLFALEHLLQKYLIPACL